MIEQYLGRGRYLAFYLACGIAGAVAYLVLWFFGILVNHPATPLVGASAGIFGVLIAAAHVAPNATVMLMFPPIPMKLKVFALVMIGIGLFMIFTGGRNAGGEAAHLGGAALGALLIRNPRWLNAFENGPIDGSRRLFGRWKQQRRWRKTGDRTFRMDDWKKP
jgi:membrane associated rhomboid family serine protease